MMASLVSSWKSQRHLDLRCPQCVFLLLWPGILPGFLLRDWYHPSILFCKTGNLASFSAPPLYPGHYQVMSAVPSQYLWIVFMPSHRDLQVQATLCLSPVLLQMQMPGLLTFTFEPRISLLHSTVSVGLKIIKNLIMLSSIKILPVSISYWWSKDFPKSL